MSREPRSVLFLSCDLVGSTQFKQATPGWQKVFLSFYREFPQFVGRRNEDVEAHGEPQELRLWKAVGDELIFEVVVRSEAQVARAVRVWLEAMEAYQAQTLHSEAVTRTLGVKGGAFIATFPGPDSESTIPRNPGREDEDADVILLNDEALEAEPDDQSFLYDYFGPSIDIGFRLLGQASLRHFTMSVEVAWALARVEYDARADRAVSGLRSRFDDVVYLGDPQLKGVWSGRGYPVFAIDRGHDDDVNKAMAELTGPGLDPERALRLCNACQEYEGWPGAVYLPDSRDARARRAPGDAMQKLRSAAASDQGAESPPGSGEEEGEPLAKDVPLG